MKIRRGRWLGGGQRHAVRRSECGGTLEEGEDGVAWVEGGGDVLEEGEDGAGTLEDGGRVAAARWRRARTAPDIREERVRVRWD